MSRPTSGLAKNVPPPKVRGGKTKFALMAQMAAQQGIQPIEVMLNVMRLQYEDGMAPTLTKYKGKPRPPNWEKLDEAVKTAAMAAPYVHPRLSAVEVLKGTNDADLNAIIMTAGIEAGLPPELIQTFIQGPDGIFQAPGQEAAQGDSTPLRVGTTRPSPPAAAPDAIIPASEPHIKLRKVTADA